MDDFDYTGAVPDCEEVFSQETAADIPQIEPKPGRLWPPLLILGILFILGLTLFFLLGNGAGTACDPAMPWFTAENGLLFFDESRYTGSSELTVPSVIAGQTVTALSDGCFAGSELTTVRLPEGITRIGSGTFSGCARLRGIVLPETLQHIGADAFFGCSALEAIAIPYTVNQIGENCFTGCGKLSYIFYAGPMAAWQALDVDISGTNANIYCYDGIYPQR